MRDRTVNRVESWDARPFSGGFATLRDMSDANFSGVVVSGDAWLFMLNGRIVGIVDGDIDDFEDASGTMYEAPDPSLPLLFSMQERAGTTQAKYYTNDTPLSEADKTLSDANFTGYVELSENVLSGDYYLVYYGGRALPVAFVGTTNELKTGDEAYELATDEVGVYEVIKTPVNVTQVPGPRSEEAEADDSGATAGAGAGAATADAASSGGGEPAREAEGRDAEPEAVEEASPEPEPERQPEPEPEPSAEAAAREEYAADTSDSVVEAAQPGESAPSEASQTESTSSESAPTEPPAQRESRTAESEEPASPASDTPTESPPETESSSTDQAEKPASEGDDSSVFSEEEQWRQTKSIPSLSPSEREKRRNQQVADSSSPEQQTKRPRSERPEGATESSQRTTTESPSGSDASQSEASTESGQRTQSQQPTAESTESDVSTPESGGAGSSSKAESSATQQSGAATETSEAGKQRIAELQSRLERLDAERGELEDDLDSTRSERDELQKRVRQLENALEEAGGDATSGPALTPDEALAGTNLFVRYGSRGAPTLDDLTGKQPDAEAINKNLRIDHHTQFESKEAAVDGTPFNQFLEQTSSFRFVSWLVRDLPYEVLDAGHRSTLGDLYEVIPEIDRAELQGVVEVETEEGDERREFDIVLRDRMGNPLVVAELNDERDPVSGDEMGSLIESAQVVGEGTDDIGAAFYVTASFFEPDALENAANATETGGILSRSDRASYVKLARKQGFHLCLAEDRNDTFHLTVPEL